jgi:hypothetical protein
MKLNLTFMNVAITPEQEAELGRRVLSWLKEFPDFCEGSTRLGGEELWFVYEARGEWVEMYLMPRAEAEEVLNQNGMSTHEPFNPLPEAKRPN